VQQIAIVLHESVDLSEEALKACISPQIVKVAQLMQHRHTFSKRGRPVVWYTYTHTIAPKAAGTAANHAHMPCLQLGTLDASARLFCAVLPDCGCLLMISLGQGTTPPPAMLPWRDQK
jgi:hypothetical protein